MEHKENNISILRSAWFLILHHPFVLFLMDLIQVFAELESDLRFGELKSQILVACLATKHFHQYSEIFLSIIWKLLFNSQEKLSGDSICLTLDKCQEESRIELFQTIFTSKCVLANLQHAHIEYILNMLPFLSEREQRNAVSMMKPFLATQVS